jgi:hypothetical protein
MKERARHSLPRTLVTFALTGGGLVLAALVLSTSGAAQAAGTGQPCGLQTLKGLYLFAASGYNIVGGVPQPKAIAEQIEFGGDGTLVVPGVTVSLNGVILQPPPGDGEYTLGDGCSGAVAFSGGPTFAIYMSPSGSNGWMIQTNANTVFQGTVTRLSR